MTNPKNNGQGVKEVATAQESKPAVNGKVSNATVAETGKPQTRSLEEQIEFFLGLERLVNIRRRFEAHSEAVKALQIEDEELNKFETGSTYGVRIELHDSQRREYNITNPRLVVEMKNYLLSLLQGKINEYNDLILNYDQK